MMPKVAAWLGLVLAQGGAVDAADPAMLQDGAYEVVVSLELPHLEDMNTRKVTTVCLTAGAGENNHGFAVLSDNNPLKRCPVSNVRQQDDSLTFDIECAGRNQARASATYVLSSQAFHGRIAMQMGGKNMTMTEAQVGHRVGACGEPKP